MKNGNDMLSADAGLGKSGSVLPRLRAQLLLGQVHLDTGRHDEAFRFFEAAARSGHPAALNMLGRAYERGWGVKRDPATAVRYFEAAAAGGDGWAMFNLADLFLTGQGVSADMRRAYDLYVASARAGIAKALNMLGVMHEDGTCPGKIPDPDGACQFYRAAADGGDCWAWLNLARLFLGQDRLQEAAEALVRGLDSAVSGVPEAVLEMSHPYRHDALFRSVRERCREMLDASGGRGRPYAA